MSYEDNIRKVVPYTPGEQPKVQGEIIKLNTNEFPYPPTKEAKIALEKLDPEVLRLYPNITAEPIVKALSEYYGFDEDEIFVGVGSDDVLANCFVTFFNSDKPLLFPDITYSFYDVWADLYKIPYKKIPLNEELRINKEDYLIENGGIIFANPNAPTGIELDTEAIEFIVANNKDSVVIVDEAYVDFGGTSVLPLIRKYDNLIVTQTFSKSRAFAGMRIGFAIGNKKLIKYLSDVKFSTNSYTMNQTSIVCGVAAVKDDAYFKETVAKVVATREWTVNELEKLGFSMLPSKANFVFATCSKKNAKDIFEYLKEKNIYVRYFDKPRINNYLRITIGTDEQMQKFINILTDYLK